MDETKAHLQSLGADLVTTEEKLKDDLSEGGAGRGVCVHAVPKGYSRPHCSRRGAATHTDYERTFDSAHVMAYRRGLGSGCRGVGVREAQAGHGDRVKQGP